MEDFEYGLNAEEPHGSLPDADGSPETAAATMEEGPASGEDAANAQLEPAPEQDGPDGQPEEQAADPEQSRRTAPRPRAGRPADEHSPLLSLKLNDLDRDLTEQERQEWNDIYASFRSKSVLTGRIIGVDGQAFNVRNRETGQIERRTMYCAVIISYRVKVLIQETEIWMPDEERPAHVLRNMSGAEIDYVILDVDREGGVAIGSRRMGAMIKRRAFDAARHTDRDFQVGDHVIVVIVKYDLERSLIYGRILSK